MFHPSLTRFATSFAAVGGDGARDLVRLAGPQDLLKRGFELRRALTDAHRTAQVAARAGKQRADAGHGGDLVEVLQAFHRFDHHRRQQVAVRIERPQVGVPLVFLAADPPDPGRVAGGRRRECRSARGTSHPSSADTACVLTANSACSGVSTPLKMTPCSPMSSACLTTHCDSSASGGKRANNATFGCRLPFLSTMPLSVIPIRNICSAGKSSGLCSRSA